MKTISQRYDIQAPAEKVWDALVNPETIDKWGGGPVKMSGEEGFEFSLWGGEIFGKNIEIIPNKKLVQEWYSGKWDNPSILTLTLEAKGDTTIVTLSQKNLPNNEADDVEEGWKDYYMNPLKDLLESE